MSIPSIAAYSLPPLAEAPANRVSWELVPQRAVLLVHDMQEYFLRFFERARSPLSQVLSHVASLATACRAAGVPVVYTAQPPVQTREQRGLLNDLWGPGITAHPHAHDIVSELRPHAGDIMVTKFRYSAFHGTDLQQRLQQLGRDQLIVCGVYAHIGCLLTACDAFMHDVQPFFATDAVADFSREHHELAIRYAAERCAVALDTSSLLAALGATAPVGARQQQALRAAVAAVLDVPVSEIADEEDLFDLGMDSIRLMALVEELRAQGTPIMFEDIAECRTLQAVCELVAAAAALQAQDPT